MRNAARRLQGDYTPTVKVTMRVGDQTIELGDGSEVSVVYQDTPNPTTEPTVVYNAADDRSLALAYAFHEQRKVEEAAARLDGSYVEREPPKKWRADWGEALQQPWEKAPRLDGRRRK